MAIFNSYVKLPVGDIRWWIPHQGIPSWEHWLEIGGDLEISKIPMVVTQPRFLLFFFSTNFCSLAFVRANSCNLGNLGFINIGWYGGVKNRSVYIDEKIPPSDGQGVNIHRAFLAPPRSSSPPRAALWNGSEAKVSPSREMGQEQHFAGNGMKLGSSNLNRANPLVNNPQDISRSEMDGKNSLQNWRFTVLLGLAHESSLTGVLFMKSINSPRLRFQLSVRSNPLW